MNEKYARRKVIRREADHPGYIYRTLLRSYLWKPPVWVYVLELVAVVALVALLLNGGGGNFSSALRALKELLPK